MLMLSVADRGRGDDLVGPLLKQQLCASLTLI